MEYVLTDGGSTVLSYPYSIGLLRRDNPNTSFPASPTLAQLAEWNVFPVKDAEPPVYDPLAYRLIESMSSPDLINGEWIQVWELVPLESTAYEQLYAEYVASANAQADSLLRETDRQVLIAFETSQKLHPDFIAYRAMLRNPADLPGYPANTEFPALPSNTFSEAVELSTDFEETIA